jgi:hypothetical protein
MPSLLGSVARCIKSAARAIPAVAMLFAAGRFVDTAWPDEAPAVNLAPADLASAAAHFDAEIAPLFARRCLDCHNPGEKKGGLDLTSLAAAKAGGDSGPVLAAALDDSLLWQRVADDEMPPKKPLPANEKALLRGWLVAGAAWGSGTIDRFRFTSDTRAGEDWWSLAPPDNPAIPNVEHRELVRNPIDAFVLARLESAGLAIGAETDRRSLIRRLSLDLLGLPPLADEIEAFVADRAPDAYERLVDRLLASPHYGQRWARHWLDVARFGESDGFEYDRLRPNAWPYRDWVVDAFNRDLPYDEFARLQIAGDVLKPDNAQAIVATGFLVAGPYDGLMPAAESMRQVMREDEMEDLVGTVSQTFLGLTVNCARCHDHKFDPIRQADYYRIAAALAGVKRGDRDMPAAVPANAHELRAQLAALQAEFEVVDAPARNAILAERSGGAAVRATPQPIARWDFTAGLQDQLGTLTATLVGEAKLSAAGLVLDGRQAYAQTPPLDRTLKAKTLEAWVSLANRTQRGGAAISLQTPGGDAFDAIVFGENEPGHWIAGSDFYRRTQAVGGAEETANPAEFLHLAITYQADGTIAIYRNGQPYGKTYKPAAPAEFAAGRAEIVFGLRHSPARGDKLLAGVVQRAALYDRALSAAEVAASAGELNRVVDKAELVTRLTPEQQTRRKQLSEQIRALESQLDPTALKVFAVTPQVAPVVHRLERGNPLAPAEVVPPGGVQAISAQDDNPLPADAPDAERRRRLADWIVDPSNPLFARVMVNRVWHYHFGVGLVETPSDFGFNGGQPAHRDLLDWLTGEFARGGFRLKPLHRAIVTSAAYRQSSRPDPAAVKVDAGNRLLWRYSPHRLEAETVRDAMLLVCGQLNTERGGPGFRDFDTYDQKGTQFYEPRDPEGSAFNRRSLYRTWARGGRNPLLDTFDCPDPSVTAPQRGVTTTPLQSLALLNNSFALRMADRFAERVAREAGSSLAEQVDRAYLLAYGRAAAQDERTRVEPFVARYGLAALCRALFNSNEFLYVD